MIPSYLLLLLPGDALGLAGVGSVVTPAATQYLPRLDVYGSRAAIRLSVLGSLSPRLEIDGTLSPRLDVFGGDGTE